MNKMMTTYETKIVHFKNMSKHCIYFLCVVVYISSSHHLCPKCLHFGVG